MIKYREKELEKARELQREALKLNLSSPPVLSWSAKLKDNKGGLVEEYLSKCNSYNRNGINLLATAGIYPTKFTKGYIAVAPLVSGDYVCEGPAIVFNGYMYLQLYSEIDGYKLAKFDDSDNSVTIVCDVDDSESRGLRCFKIYDGNLYALSDDLTDGRLYVLSGNSLILVDSEYHYVDCMEVHNGKLYYGGASYTGKGNLYEYDGSSISTIFSAASEQGIGAMKSFNGSLYTIYKGPSGIRRWDGGSTTTQIYDTSSGEDFTNNCIIFNNHLVFMSSKDYDVYIRYMDTSEDIVNETIVLDRATDDVYGMVIYDNKLMIITKYKVSNSSYNRVIIIDEDFNSFWSKYSYTANYSNICVYNNKLYSGYDKLYKTIMFNGGIIYRRKGGEYYCGAYNSTISSNDNDILEIGVSDTDYGLESYKLELVSGWTKSDGTRDDIFDESTNTYKVKIGRSFNNVSGEDCYIKEIGIYINISNIEGSTENCLVVRDILEVPILVLNGHSIFFEYCMEIAYPQ